MSHRSLPSPCSGRAPPCFDSGRLTHGMKPDHIALGIDHQGDESVFADGHFFEMDASAGGLGAGGLGGAVLAREIDEGSAVARILVFHLAERAGAAGLIGAAEAGKGPHLEVRVRTRKFVQGDLKDALVEGLGPLHVPDIDLEPADGIALGCVHDFGVFGLFLGFSRRC